MYLPLSDAVNFVRSRIDELSYNNDDMISPADDDRNFDKTVEKLLPEAAEAVFRAAPAALLEPEKLIQIPSLTQIPSGVESASIQGGVMVFVLNYSSGFLRLVSFKSGDSDIYVTIPTAFDSPEARKQTNPYTKGTYDAPVLIERKLPGKEEFSYYSARGSSWPGASVYTIDKPSYTDDKTIFCPSLLDLAVLNRLVGMVLDAYGDQRSQLFYQKSNSYPA